MSKCEKRQIVPGGQLPCIHYIRTAQGQPGLCKLGSKFLCTEAIKTLAPRLSHSAVQTWCRCRREYYYSYIQGIRVKDAKASNAIKLGKIWDKACDSYYNENTFMFDGLTEIIDKLEIPPYEAAKVLAVIRATESLQLQLPKKITPQVAVTELLPPVENYTMPFVKAVYDGKGPGFFIENKFVGNPQNYLAVPNITSQVGTYFMLDSSLQYCIMQVVRRPGQKPLKAGRSRNVAESVDGFEERIFQDIISRPSYYFVGWDKKAKTFGKRFYRNEFDFSALIHRYMFVAQEIRECEERGSFYQNENACIRYGDMCEYRPICDTGGVSEEIFERRDKDVYARG